MSLHSIKTSSNKFKVAKLKKLPNMSIHIHKILNKKFLNPYLEIETASGHQLKPSSKNWMSKVIGRKLKVVNLRSKFLLKNLKLTIKNRKSKPKGEFLNKK